MIPAANEKKNSCGKGSDLKGQGTDFSHSLLRCTLYVSKSWSIYNSMLNKRVWCSYRLVCAAVVGLLHDLLHNCTLDLLPKLPK